MMGNKINENLINIENNKYEDMSPMMKQYLDTKAQYPDCILFFRIGDFYETFFDQAKLVSMKLNLVLTGKDCGLDEKAPMCGVPHHAVDVYMSKLVKMGYKVAIAEQMEDPQTAKGIVKREVTRVLTPGTVTSGEYLEEKINNYIMSIYFNENYYGVAMFDFSTGEFFICNAENEKRILDLIYKYEPKEILINNNVYQSKLSLNEIKDNFTISWTVVDDNIYNLESLKIAEYELLDVVLNNIENYNKIKSSNAIYSSIAVYYYVKENQKAELTHLEKIEYLVDDSYMYLDAMTIRNLELVESIRGKDDKKGTLIGVIDWTRTAMGARLLRRFIENPLKDKNMILYRQEAVKSLIGNAVDHTELREYMSAIYDLDRIFTRINLKHANPRDFIAFKNSIYVLPYIKSLLKCFDAKFFNDIANNFDTLKDIYELIDKSIIDDPPLTMHDGNIIKTGFNEQIDKLRESKVNGKQWLVDLEEKEKQKTGIKNLKIKYSRLTGYLFEISNVYKGEVPDYFVRKQTLANGERYTTKELTELQNILLNAEDGLKSLEYEVFAELRDNLAKMTHRVKTVSNIIANVDALSSLAYVANKNNYTCPNINDDGRIIIKEGRHPVIETFANIGVFITNDTELDSDNYINIITGPNMAGKSTYMRQVALICLLMQIGSFVPAKFADICISDRIFTRIGASDDLTRGKSTFMVEMSEVANIIENATEKSLIILDEVGRGTSTYDGLSIAWSIIEYLSDKIKAKTLFATHYHELTELENVVNGVRNFNVEVYEDGDKIEFLRKIKRGSAKKSYGIAVAKLAGLPNDVTERAKEHLDDLMKNQ